ncbi:MAG TPA: hypothetical protein VIH26_10955 [Anaerolineales bacterium]
MNGAMLETAELAYMLATIDASGLIGVDDPKLLPSSAKAQEATFSKGRKQLEAHGWIQPIPDKPGEHDLNAGLFQLVAVAAAPEQVIATSAGESPDDRRQVLHYLAEELIVELWATSDKSYFLTSLPDRAALNQRMTELLGLAKSAQEGQITLTASAFNKLKSHAQKGQQAQAEKLLEASEANGPAAKSLLAALGSSARGRVVVIRASAGEIAAGRRAELFGEKKGAWMAVRPNADSNELTLSPVDPVALEALVEGWLGELGPAA